MKSNIFISVYEKFHRKRKPRLLSVACYFGLAPILFAAGVDRQRNHFLNYHLRNSLMVSLLFFWFWVTLAFAGVALYLSSSPETATILVGFARLLDYINTGILLAWMIAGGIGIFSAWAGNTPYLPILSNIARHKSWMNFALFWTVFMQAGLIILVILAMHGAFLSRETSNPPQAYILYTQGGYISLPQWYASYTTRLPAGP